MTKHIISAALAPPLPLTIIAFDEKELVTESIRAHNSWTYGATNMMPVRLSSQLHIL